MKRKKEIKEEENDLENNKIILFNINLNKH